MRTLPICNSFAESSVGTNGPGLRSGATFWLVARGQANVEPVLLELIPNVLEALILRERDRARIAFALELAWRVVHVGLHQLLNSRVYGDNVPSVRRKVVHKDVIALLRVLPHVKDLRNRRHIGLRA